MMASDSGSSPPALDPETVAVVRAALLQYVRVGAHTDDLRAVLGRLSEEARARRIPAERLLVILKDIWNGIPEVRLAAHAQLAQQNLLLQQLISRCIQQYYAE